ncbi:hypothetical protein ES703_13128 [subsurface metagenome]
MARTAKTQRRPGEAKADKNRKETKRIASKSGLSPKTSKRPIIYVTSGDASDISPTAAKKQSESRKKKSAKKQPKKQSAEVKEHVVKAYDWLDEQGDLLAQHLRYEPKRFGWRRPNLDNPPNLEKRADLNHPDDKKHWIYNLDEPNAARVKEIPYRVQEHLRAINDLPLTEPIYLVEGEHDYETCWDKGLFAVTFGGGANVWRKEYNDWFDAARPIMILTDNDKAGEKRSRIAAGSLKAEKLDRIIKIILLPDLSEGGDITDWLNQRHHIKELNHIVESAIEFKLFAPKQTGDQIILERLSDIEPVPINWLWFPRYPLGKVGMLVGNPDVGKSFLSLDMAARISTGSLWPDVDNLPEGSNRAPKGNVIILTAEDGLADTVRPRLDKMEADCSKIFALKGVHLEQKDEQPKFWPDNKLPATNSFSLSRDLEALEKKLKQVGDVKLIIIDPLSAYYGTRIDTHRNAAIRSVLMPLAELAERQNVCIIGITHLRKTISEAAIYRVTGSIGQTAQARVAWLIYPKKENRDRRLLICLKNNLSREKPGLAFEIIDGRVEYEKGIISETADEIFQDESEHGANVQEAIEFLDGLFVDDPNPKAIVVLEKARKAGISERTLRRAKAERNIISRQHTSGYWRWEKAEQERGDKSEDKAT